MDDKELVEIIDTPRPYVKCNKCGADIRLDSPERVLECSYVAEDPFEKRLQQNQHCLVVPVLRLWKQNPRRFNGHTVTVLCSRPCAAGEQRFALDKVLWA